MATSARALDLNVLGCWLIKGNRNVYPIDELVETGFSTVSGWSLYRTYRTDLIEPGQPVVFWVSGSDRVHPSGVYAQGTTVDYQGHGVASEDWVDPKERGRSKLFMRVELDPLSTPVLRSDLLTHPTLSEIEVIKMPGGSNPSYLTKQQLAELRHAWPQVTLGE